MSPCCGEDGQCSKSASPVQVQTTINSTEAAPDSAPQSQTKCCTSTTGCACDDTCLDQLARAVCADDDGHLHATHEQIEGGPSIPDECCESKDECAGSQCAPMSTSGSGGKGGLRLRKSAKPATDDACSEHRKIVRKRHSETLSAFGCICKAMLARGLQSCCSSRAPLATSVSASIRNLRSASNSKVSVTSCCSDSACGKSVKSSRRSVDSCCGDRACGKSVKSRRSVDSCCNDGACAKSVKSSRRPVASCSASGCCEDAGRAEIRSIARRSSASVDSCADSCCRGANSDEEDGDPEKRSSILEKGLADDDNHCVLAVKGMTCVGCEKKLIQVLKTEPAISNIKTSLVLCRAEFDYHCDPSDLDKLVQTIQTRTGFNIEQVAAPSSPSARVLEITTPLPDKFAIASHPVGVSQVVKVNKDTVRVTYDPRIIGARDIMTTYETCSPTLAPVPTDPTLTAGAKHVRVLLMRTVVSALLTIPVLVMTWAPLPSHPRAYGIASLILATLVQVGIAGPFYRNALKSLFVGIIEIDLLVVLSTTTAYTYSIIAFAFEMAGRPLEGGSFFETSTLLVTLIMFGQLASAFARQRAVAAISLRSLQEPKAIIVTTLPDGRTRDETIDTRLLQYDDIFRVLPDSFVITDGKIVSGVSAVDESMMTGESLPVERTVGHDVLAGTRNGGGSLLVRVTRLPGENTISDIADMVDDVRSSRARIQGLVDRLCTWFVPSVLVLTLLTFVVWILIGIYVRHQSHGEAAVRALTYAIAVLAISCPCAIGLAVPMVVLVASGVAARLGLVFKAATTIESARQITHVVFDKTGTLTTGQLHVVESACMQDTITSANGASVSAMSVIIPLVSASKHPVARAVAQHLSLGDHQLPAGLSVEHVEEITSKGVQGTLAGKLTQGGSAQWLGFENDARIAPLLAKGHATFAVAYDGHLLAVFALSDPIRAEVPTLLTTLTNRNIKVSILSGDHLAAVRRIASTLSIPAEMTQAGCLPADKAAYIRTLQSRGDKVLFCGDGTNDSVALAQADVGVHMSSEASATGAGAAASSAADAVLLRPSLDGIIALIRLSDAVYRRIVLNFTWAAVYNTVAVLFASGAFVNARIAPAYAGLGEIVSVLPVVLIAMQLKWFSG